MLKNIMKHMNVLYWKNTLKIVEMNKCYCSTMLF